MGYESDLFRWFQGHLANQETASRSLCATENHPSASGVLYAVLLLCLGGWGGGRGRGERERRRTEGGRKGGREVKGGATKDGQGKGILPNCRKREKCIDNEVRERERVNR